MLAIIAFILLLCSYFIPGNLNRLSQQNELFKNASIFGKAMIKLPSYFRSLLKLPVAYILLFVSITFSYSLLKKAGKVNKIFGLFLVITNIGLFINNYVYSFIDFETVNILLYTICFIYLLVNLYACFIISKGEHQIYFYLIIASICANLVSVVLIEYSSIRFYYILIIFWIIFSIHYYLESDETSKIFMLFLFCLVSCWWLGLILYSCYIIFGKVLKNKLFMVKSGLVFLFILLNISSFSKCMYCYYENSKIYDYNIDVLNNIEDNNQNTLYLKKLKYPDYAFHMPEKYDYVTKWYKGFYGIINKKIIWVED